MNWTEISFWVCLGIVFYAFVVCGIVWYVLVTIKRIVKKNKGISKSFEPGITLVIPCFNEADILADKITNYRHLG